MESNIIIRCRKEDKDMLQSVTDDAIKAYRDLIIKEVVKFQDKSPEDIPCKIVIDDTPLESIEDNETTGILGGFKLYAKRGRIVCSQTIDDRIDLCF
jgi:hypothetical protein